jgi:hypothetical protein
LRGLNEKSALICVAPYDTADAAYQCVRYIPHGDKTVSDRPIDFSFDLGNMVPRADNDLARTGCFLDKAEQPGAVHISWAQFNDDYIALTTPDHFLCLRNTTGYVRGYRIFKITCKLCRGIFFNTLHGITSKIFICDISASALKCFVFIPHEK